MGLGPTAVRLAIRHPLTHVVTRTHLHPTDTEEAPLVSTGALPSASVVQELVNMIQTQRAYEINSKAVQTSDQMLQTLSQMSV